MIHQMKNIKIQWRHVRGHQDDHMAGPFDTWTTRNILMDLRADLVWAAVPVLPSNTRVPFSTWKLRINDRYITTDFYQKLREHCTAPGAEAYWLKKKKIDQAPATHVAWSALGTAMQEVKTSRRHWVVKHSTGRCAVGRVMQRRKKWDHDKCPRCGQENETVEHLLLCPAHEVRLKWETSVQQLHEWLKQKGTHPQLAALLCSRLLQWSSGQALTPINSNVPGLNNLAQQQDAIGWLSTIEGKWTK
jgi:hypothetical protein